MLRILAELGLGTCKWVIIDEFEGGQRTHSLLTNLPFPTTTVPISSLLITSACFAISCAFFIESIRLPIPGKSKCHGFMFNGDDNQ